MQHFSIPACYFPSMVLFLDDGYDFLLNVMLQLDERVAYRLFDAPIEALGFINHYRYEFEVLNRHCMSEYTEAKKAVHEPALRGLAPLYAEVYNPYRFSEISVVVVDVAPRGMDGFEFCRRIDNSSIKKIVLIQDSDELQAEVALKQGLIDCYIKKNNEHLVDVIKKQIDLFQLSYFIRMSEMVSRFLPISLPACLYDKKLATFFHDFREEHGIIEYYLIDPAGGFLMLNEDAKESVFLIKSEQDWCDRLVPSQRFIGEIGYVYAHVPHHAGFTMQQKNIFSYHRYLDELDAEELVLS